MTLIFSYFDDHDFVVPCGREELVQANVKRLLRFAQRNLPTGVSDAAVVKIDRCWIANSLADWELLHAFTYARIREVCAALAHHLGSQLSETIPDSTLFDPLMSDARRTRYMKLAGGEAGGPPVWDAGSDTRERDTLALSEHQSNRDVVGQSRDGMLHTLPENELDQRLLFLPVAAPRSHRRLRQNPKVNPKTHP